jgi:hypothetical protein
MKDRSIIFYTEIMGETLARLLDRAGFLARNTEMILCRSINSLIESLYRHGIDQPVVILVLQKEDEVTACLELTSLLQRFDVIVMLVDKDLVKGKRVSLLRPRMVITMDDDPGTTELLIKGVLAKIPVNRRRGRDGVRA